MSHYKTPTLHSAQVDCCHNYKNMHYMNDTKSTDVCLPPSECNFMYLFIVHLMRLSILQTISLLFNKFGKAVRRAV